eukprot:2829189-Amphidinium_carterae.1
MPNLVYSADHKEQEANRRHSLHTLDLCEHANSKKCVINDSGARLQYRGSNGTALKLAQCKLAR